MMDENEVHSIVDTDMIELYLTSGFISHVFARDCDGRTDTTEYRDARTHLKTDLGLGW